MADIGYSTFFLKPVMGNRSFGDYMTVRVPHSSPWQPIKSRNPGSRVRRAARRNNAIPAFSAFEVHPHYLEIAHKHSSDMRHLTDRYNLQAATQPYNYQVLRILNTCRRELYIRRAKNVKEMKEGVLRRWAEEEYSRAEREAVWREQVLVNELPFFDEDEEEQEDERERYYAILQYWGSV